MNYYNEYDKKTAAWLRELIKQRLIPHGVVDERSITDVRPSDLAGYTQCHFFAGIGGWSLALQIAGWPSDRPVWTGSCPCQPFSTAGKGLAQADERHLWPAFFNLIKECRPEHVFGEQVASAIGKGWLDGISADLGEEGYTCGSAVLGAHSVGSPHIRQRLYWVANSNSRRFQQCDEGIRSVPEFDKDGANGWVADAGYMRGRNRPIASREARDEVAGCSDRVDDSECAGLQGFSELGSVDPGNGLREGVGQPTSASGDNSRMGDTQCQQHERRGGAGDVGCPPDQEQGEAWERQWGRDADSGSSENDHGLANTNGIRSLDGINREEGQGPEAITKHCSSGWPDFTLVACRDGKTRRIPTEPAFFPLAHGIPARVVRLRGYGNAIVPQVAAEFAKACCDLQRSAVLGMSFNEEDFWG
jgi:DNA (cytosine-5)-methyltransferase 1